MKTRFFLPGTLLLTGMLLLCFNSTVIAQRGGINWAKDGYQYFTSGRDGGIDELDTRDSAKKTVVITKEMLTPQGKAALTVSGFKFSDDDSKV